jgi:hypothetical protein
MDDELLAILRKIEQNNGQEDIDGREDYQEFLANFMHAKNFGAEPDELERLMKAHSPERIDAMYSSAPIQNTRLYHGMTNLDENDPNIGSDGFELRELLSKYGLGNRIKRERQ